MKQQDVFKKIGIIIKELNEQYDYLGSTDTHLNDLELELFVANAHFLAEHSEVLRKLNTINNPPPATTPEPEAPRDEKYFEPVVQQVITPVEKPVTEEKPAELPPDTPAPVEAEIAEEEEYEDTPVPHIDLAANGADDDFSFIRQTEPEIIKHELILDESQNWEDEDDEGFKIDEITEPEEEEVAEPVKVDAPKSEVVKNEPKEELNVVSAPVEAVEVKKEILPPAEVKKESPQVEIKKEPVAVEIKKESAQEEPLTINQMISAQLNKSSKTPEHAHEQPVADLKQAITLNDKLLYIKDLFNGYNLAYSEAIDILNRYTSFEEANNFLKSNYATKNHWDTKQATVDKFYALLRRRYAS